MKKTALLPIIGSAALLAVMGLVFTWFCPESVNLHPESPHWMTSRMVVFNLTGLLLGGGAVAVGWKRWLRTAPYILIAWVGLVCYAATQPPVNGSWVWISTGIPGLSVNVWDFCPLVIGLTAAWISWKFGMRPVLVMLVLALAMGGVLAGQIVTNANRMLRLKVFFGQATEMPPLEESAKASCFLANQSAGIIREAKWFGETEIDPKILPCAATAAMPARAAAMWGKWYLVLLCAVFGLLGAGFAGAWVSVRDNPRRTLVLALAITVLGGMMSGYLGSLLITPMKYSCIPWASFGGMTAAVYWMTLGVLASALTDREDPARELAGHEVIGIGGAAILYTILLALAIGRVQSRTDVKLYGHPGEMPCNGECPVTASERDPAIEDKIKSCLLACAPTNCLPSGCAVVYRVSDGKRIASCSIGEFTPETAYEPGSVVKSLTAVAAIDKGVAKMDSLYSTERDDPKYYRLPGDGDYAFKEQITMEEALAVSCNVVFGKLGVDVGPESLISVFNAMGIGAKGGRLPDAGRVDNVMKSRIAVGQGVLATPDEIAHAYMIIASHGVNPRTGKAVVSSSAADAVALALRQAASKAGTGRRATVEGLVVAGKTGTAQRCVNGKYVRLFNATFAGFAPADKPDFVIVVTYQTDPRGDLLYQGGGRTAMAFSQMASVLLGQE